MMDGPVAFRYRPVPQDNPDRSDLRHELVVQQQPKHARSTGGGEKADRRPIDPPPIVRLRIHHLSTGTQQALIQSPFLFCYASICLSTDDEELLALGETKRRYLTGSCVSSLYHLRDPDDGSHAAYFVFPDIGVRVEGAYRFKFAAYELVNSTAYLRATIYSDVFNVYGAKKFPGMDASTPLSKAFADQGLRIRIRKPPVKSSSRKSKASTPDSDVDGDAPYEPDESESVVETPRKRARVDSAHRQPAPAPTPPPLMPQSYSHPFDASHYDPSPFRFAPPPLASAFPSTSGGDWQLPDQPQYRPHSMPMPMMHGQPLQHRYDPMGGGAAYPSGLPSGLTSPVHAMGGASFASGDSPRPSRVAAAAPPAMDERVPYSYIGALP